MTPEISALDDHLGYWLRFVSNSVSHAFAAKLAGQGVTAAEWVVLRTLFDGDGLTPSTVAGRLGMTRGAISKLADRLEAKALVTRSFSESDRRSQLLALSREGRVLVPQLAGLADRNDAEFFDHLPTEDRATLVRIMKSIVAHRRLKAVPTE